MIRRLRDFEYATLRYIQVLMNKYRSIKSMVFCFQKDMTVQPKKLLKVGTVGCHFAFSIHLWCFLIQLWQCDFWSCHWIIDIKLNIEFVLFEVMEMPTFTKPSDTWDSCSMYIFASNLSNNRFRVLDREIQKFFVTFQNKVSSAWNWPWDSKSIVVTFRDFQNSKTLQIQWNTMD